MKTHIRVGYAKRILHALLSSALTLSLFSALSISQPTVAHAVASPTLGTGGENFTVGKASVTVINSTALTGNGQALQIANYPASYTLQVTVATGGTGTVKITSDSGLTLVPGNQATLICVTL
jgi:hypothetical protein